MAPNNSKRYANNFSIEWYDKHDDFKKWLQPVDGDENSGWWSLCQKLFDVRGIRINAFTSHGSVLKHKRLIAIKFSKSNPSILGFLNKVPSLKAATSTSDHENKVTLLCLKNYDI